MTRNLFVACVLSIACAGVVSAQETYSSTGHHTQAQLKQLVRQAHTPEQYKALAAGYESQQKDFLQQADEEKQEWARRSQNVVASAAKYPRPVDSARYLYEYYMYKASEAGKLSAKYSLLAAPASPVKEQ